ncbi:predicted protein [Sparassis crispa]|uniref:Uncharacterized protein n=1 Tax=Sparassis crispa TaxID=139825 RepID=A0A401GTT1_9APHY|nr:predicted protein [Sparassis crispa]GBE85635.1 predicted protein [Sparassis crispa]
MATEGNIQILVQTELQEDYTVQAPLGISGEPTSGLALNTDRNGRLNVFYITNNKIMNATQVLEPDGNTAQTWTVEDTGFPTTVVPQYVRAILLPSGYDFVVALGNDHNVYTLSTTARYPVWSAVKKSNSSWKPSTLSPLITNDGTLLIAALMSDGKVFKINPVKGTWSQDASVKIASSSVIELEVSGLFGGLRDDSTFGYLLSGKVLDESNSFSSGLAIVTSCGKLPTVRNIASGTFNSLAHVSIDKTTSTPLIFAIDQYHRATYFKADGRGGYASIYPLGETVKVTQLDAVLRKGVNVENQSMVWIEVLAMDTSGNLWHVESAPSADTPPSPSMVISSITQATNGDFIVTKWRSPAIISSAAITGFALSDSGQGFSYLVATSTSSQSTVLTSIVQDPTTSDWTTTRLAESSMQVGDVVRRSVYYIEVTCRDENQIQMPGLSAIVSAIEYADVDINGVTTTLDGLRSHSTLTNPQGKICITTPVDNELGCPTFTIWVEGMNAEHHVDVQPSGNIQAQLASITSDELKNAQDQTDGSYLFADLTDTQRSDLATSLNKTMQVFSNTPLVVPSTSLSRRYMHGKTNAAVARTRMKRDRSLARIHHNRSHVALHVSFRSGFSVNVVSHEEAAKLAATIRASGLPSLDLSWGDLWESVKNGFSTISSTIVDPVGNAVDATVTFWKDTVEYLWTGAATFVKQGFDLVSALFGKFKCGFNKLLNWLGYIFNWDDIKQTAAAFRQKFVALIENGKDCVNNQLPSLIDPFFLKAKAYLQDNYDSVVTETSTTTLDPKASGTSTDAIDDLPSSATWLFNKVINAPNGGSGGSLSPSFLGLESLFEVWQTFLKKMLDTGISDDFKKALESVVEFFKTLNSRDIIEGQTIAALLKVCKNALVLLIDYAQGLVDTALTVVSQVLDIILRVFDTPIEMPILSAIFHALGWEDFTLWTIVCTPIAIPFTIAYKVLTGAAPFQTQNEDGLYILHAKAKSRSLGDYVTLSQGIIAALYIFVDGSLDLINLIRSREAPGAVAFEYPAERMLNGYAVGIPLLQFSLSLYPLLDPAPDDPAYRRTVVGWVMALFFNAYNSFITCGSNLRCTARVVPPFYQPVGLTLLGGFAGWASPFMHLVNMIAGSEPNNTSTRASLAGEWLLPLSCWGKSLIMIQDPYLIAAATQLILDYVAGYGAFASWVYSFQQAG